MTWTPLAEGLARTAAHFPEIWHIPLGTDGMMEVWQEAPGDLADGDGMPLRSWYSRWRNATGVVAGEFGPYTTRSEAIEQAVLAWYSGAPAPHPS